LGTARGVSRIARLGEGPRPGQSLVDQADGRRDGAVAVVGLADLAGKAQKPFAWTKFADEILETLAAYCRRIIDSGRYSLWSPL
jgi:hypothetical protein